MARWPLTRRNLDSAQSNPALHQRFRMSPSRQRVTRERYPPRHHSRPTRSGWSSPGSGAAPPDTPNRTTVSVSSNPSRRLDAASGLIRASQRAVPSSDGLGGLVVGLLIGCTESPLQLGHVLLRDVSLDVSLLVDLAPLDHRVLAPDPLRGRVQGLGAVEHQQRRPRRVEAPLLAGLPSSAIQTAAFSVAP